MSGPNKMNLKLEEAAVGIYRTISANMGNALRNVTIEKGFDPREFALVSYGGCGPLFVANICKELQIKSILIPENSAVWSAFGACVSDVKRDIANTYYTALPTDIGALISAFKDIEANAKKLVKEPKYISRFLSKEKKSIIYNDILLSKWNKKINKRSEKVSCDVKSLYNFLFLVK